MATVASARRRRSGIASRHRRRSPASALIRRALRDARVRTITFAYIFAAVAYIQPVAYRHAYPTQQDRLSFAHSFANNKAVVLFYGKAHDLLTVGGYSAWRVGGTLAIFAAVFGMLAAVRAMRTEEDAGRAELVLAGIVRRRTWYLCALAAIAGGALVLWFGMLVGLLAGGLAAGDSAYLALAVVSMVPVFAGVGALVCQIAPTRRLALEFGGAAVALAFLLRVIADTAPSLDWLRWLTPLGWAEELRPFTGARPAVLLAPTAASAVLIVLAGRIAVRRDVGSGLIAAHDSARPRTALLSSPTSQTLRGERGSLITWLAGAGLFGAVIGVVSKSVSSIGISKQLQQELEKLGSGSVLSPTGYISFAFIFFVLAVSLFVCGQIAAARNEEAEQRLETLLSLPVGRGRWLGGRLILAALAAAAIALDAAVLAWAGAQSQGVSLSLLKMLEAGLNCLPVGLLFLGLGAVAYALVPRASAGIAYGLVAVAFLWQLFGSLLGVPKWLVNATPFAHVGWVPAQHFKPVAAVVMLAIGVVAGAAAIALFERRDLNTA
jgi:ABC-2 type transport system permease protein